MKIYETAMIVNMLMACIDVFMGKETLAILCMLMAIMMALLMIEKEIRE